MDYYSKLDYRFLKCPARMVSRNRCTIHFQSSWTPVEQTSHPDKIVNLYLEQDVGGGSIAPLYLEASNHFLVNHFDKRNHPLFIKTIEALTDRHYPQFNKIIERRYLIDPYTQCGQLFKITCRSRNGGDLHRWVTALPSHVAGNECIDPHFSLLMQIISYLVARLGRYDEVLGIQYQNDFYSLYESQKSAFNRLFGFEYYTESLIENLRFLTDNVNSEREHSVRTYPKENEVDRLRDTIDSVSHYTMDGLGSGVSHISDVMGNDPLTFSHIGNPIPLADLTMINDNHRIDYSPCKDLYLGGSPKEGVKRNDDVTWLLGTDVLDLIESTHMTDAHLVIKKMRKDEPLRVEVHYEICRFAPYLFSEEVGDMLRGKENRYYEIGFSIFKALPPYIDRDIISWIEVKWNYDDQGLIEVYSVAEKPLLKTFFDFNELTFLAPVTAVDNLSVFMTESHLSIYGSTPSHMGGH